MNNVLVRSIFELDDMVEQLKKLTQSVNEERVWKCFETGSRMFNTVIFISDIGSLLHHTAYLGVKGL